MPRLPKAVIFDFDGTLIDSSAAIVSTFNCVLHEFQLPPWDEAEIRRGIGKPLVDLFRQVTGDLGPDPEKLLQAYRRLSRENGFEEVQLLPGVEPALSRLHRRARLGIATSRSHGSTREILRRLCLETRFEAVVGIDMVANPKPHPESVQRVLSYLQVRPRQALMVGDTPDDMLAARQAGVAAIGVTTGAYNQEALKAAGAFQVIDSLSELLESGV